LYYREGLFLIFLLPGRIQEFVQERPKFSFVLWGAKHPLGPKIPLKTIDFTAPEGG